jgi:hypothetical protein
MHSKIMFFVVAAALVLAGCGGRAANPVMISQFGDNKKSCDALQLEMSQIQDSIQKLIPKTEKTGKNTALGVTGFFFIVPLFFMDLSQSEQIEVDAFRQRYNGLAVIATDKGCGAVEQIPSFDKAQAKDAKDEKATEKK